MEEHNGHAADRPRRLRIIAQGKEALNEQLRAAVEQTRERGHSVEVRLTWEPSDLQRYTDEAIEDAVDVIVAAGGDGSIHAVANALVRPPAAPACALGLLPFGTGNDLATSCGYDCDDPSAALLLAAEREPVLVDVIQIADQVIVNVATGGPGTQITQETPSIMKKFLGKAAYALNGIRHLGDLKAEQAEVIAPDLSWQGAFYILAIGNGRQAGGGMQLCPRAMLDDGLLDLVIVPEMPLKQLISVVADIRQGTHLDRDDIIYRQVSHLQLRAPQPMQLNADGEPMQISDVELRVLPRYLPLLLPVATPVCTDARHAAAATSTPEPLPSV